MTNTSAITFADVLSYVGSTGNTEEIRALFDAGNARIKHLNTLAAAELSATLKAGDKVEICNLKPKYLNGNIGTVVRIDRSGPKPTLLLDCGPMANLGRYGSGGRIDGVPISAVRPA